jgi:hypothetical protein
VHRSGAVHAPRLTAGTIALVIKRRCKLAGLDPQQFSGHSSRAGFVTSVAENGANLFKILDVTRHKSVDVMKGNVRSREMFKDYAGDGIL